MPATILLTGASGYIGSRLLRVLEEAGCAVRCLARQPGRIVRGRTTTEVVAGDCLDEASLVAAMEGVDQAYYLVHSMAGGPGFAARDRRAAAGFGRAAARAGVRRIIYLGALGEDHESLSTHLKSRLETGKALREAGIPVVEFRASIVVGAGSLSFEMIRALVERLPVMICPRWLDTSAQPVAIDDVLAYLRAAIDLPDGRGGVFEIGGPEVVSYGDMMREYARLRRLRRLLIPVPVLTPRLSGLWLGLVTPVQARVGRALVEGLRNPTVVRSPAARETFEIRPMPLREAFRLAIEEDAPAQRKFFRGLLRRIAQLRGPFAIWRHTHLFESIGPSQTLYQDRIEFGVSHRGALNRVAAAVLRPVLTLACAHRHRIVRARVGGTHRRVASGWAAVALAAAATLQPATPRAQAAAPVRTVPFVDLDRYAGDWFEIARLPNRFQRECVGDVRASYARRPDGRLDVVNRCRTADGQTEARGVARIVDEQTFARLEVRFAPAWLSFLPLVWGDYWIIGLAPDYSWAVVGEPGREYLWILAREPRLDDESVAAARAAARASGYDVARLVQTSHTGAARP